MKGCGKPGHPGVYVKVTEVLDWIKHTSRGNRHSNVPVFHRSPPKNPLNEAKNDVISPKMVKTDGWSNES